MLSLTISYRFSHWKWTTSTNIRVKNLRSQPVPLTNVDVSSAWSPRVLQKPKARSRRSSAGPTYTSWGRRRSGDVVAMGWSRKSWVDQMWMDIPVVYYGLLVILWCFNGIYGGLMDYECDVPSGYVQIATENGHRNRCSHETSWFSIAMLNYQRQIPGWWCKSWHISWKKDRDDGLASCSTLW